MEFRIASKAFHQGGTIPMKYTCSGADVSPPLAWSEPPAGTKSLVLIVDDPDTMAGTWYHWLVYNMPGRAGAAREGASRTGALPEGAVQGRNSFGKMGYGGPCPPAGQTHRYFFHLYALDTVLKLRAGATQRELEAAMRGHVKGEAEWMGHFGR